MVRFVLVRVVTTICLLFVLSTITFLVYATLPAEPAGFLVDVQHAKPGQIAAADHALVPGCVVRAYARPQRRTFREDSGAAPE